MREPGWWLEKKREEFQGYDKEVVKSWVEFIDALADIVGEDGYVDFTDPECIDAYVGPPYALIRLDAENRRIDVECAEQAHPPRSFYRKSLHIMKGLGDMSEWAIVEPKAAAECGTIIAKGMFELRKGQVCN